MPITTTKDEDPLLACAHSAKVAEAFNDPKGILRPWPPRVSDLGARWRKARKLADRWQ